MIFEFEGKRPVIGKGSFVFPSATIIGDVTIGENCYIGAGARIRGDYGTIVIGSHSAVEDNCVIHARPEETTVVGDNVTLGHACILHNCTIKDWAVIGMGAIVSDYAEVGIWAAIGEGAVVKNKQHIPDGAIAVGLPAKIIGETSEAYREQWGGFKEIYNRLADTRNPESLVPIPDFTDCME
jgi:phenylacetic acid degradation protein